MSGAIERWMPDKGFGFARVKGQVVFCHKNVVRGPDSLGKWEEIIVAVGKDKVKGEGFWSAKEVWGKKAMPKTDV